MRNDYYIGKHFVTALVYGDTTGLDDLEELDFDDWRDRFSDTTTFEIHSEEPEFKDCDITGLKSDCVRVTAHDSKYE